MFFQFLFIFPQSSTQINNMVNLVLWGDSANRWATLLFINNEVLFASQRLRRCAHSNLQSDDVGAVKEASVEVNQLSIHKEGLTSHTSLARRCKHFAVTVCHQLMWGTVRFLCLCVFLFKTLTALPQLYKRSICLSPLHFKKKSQLYS